MLSHFNILPYFLPNYSSEGRSFPDGALHATAGAHHPDQRQRVRRGRLLLPAVHGFDAPPGGNAICFCPSGNTRGGGEAGSCGGRRGRVDLRVATQQACCHPALDAQRPGDTRYKDAAQIWSDGWVDD